MQKIIPFKKDILFKNVIDEITSISMDHHLERENYQIKGDFIVEGEYTTSEKKDTFHFEIPYLGYLEENFNVDNVELDIDDFYYEIIDSNKLSIHIDIAVDKLTEKPLLEEKVEAIPVLAKEEDKEPVVEKEEEVREEEREEQTVFESPSHLEEAYITYKVYIVREGDTISSILEKYQIEEEKLRKYNVINELSIGDKLIIPNEQN